MKIIRGLIISLCFFIISTPLYAESLIKRKPIPEADPLAVHVDGTTPLTANWPAGAFDIKALSFSIGLNTLDTGEWAYLDGLDQALKTTSSPTFIDLTLTTLNISSRQPIEFTASGGSWVHLDFANRYFGIQGTDSSAVVSSICSIVAPIGKSLLFELFADGEGGGWAPHLTIESIYEGDVRIFSGNSIYLQPSNDFDDYIKFQTISDIPEITTIGACDLKINAGGTNDLLLNDGGGNVGIGITPTKKLEVNGKILSHGHILMPGNAFVFGPNITGDHPWMYGQGSGADGWGENLYIDVYDTGAQIYFRMVDLDDYIGFKTSSDIPEIYTIGACDLKINAGGANDLLLNDSGGYVGIGTSIPAEELDVIGAIRSKNTNVNEWGKLEHTGSELDITTGSPFGEMADAVSCTADSDTETFTAVGHGMANDTRVQIDGSPKPSGITVGKLYYVVNAATDTFQVALSEGGNAVNLSNNGTDVVFYEWSGPSVSNDIRFFYDESDLPPNVDGKSIYFYRRSAYSDDYLRFYLDDSHNANIISSDVLSLESYGTKPFYINRTTGGDAYFFLSNSIDNDDDGNELKIYRTADEFTKYLRIFVNSGGTAVLRTTTSMGMDIHAFGDLRLQDDADGDVTIFSGSADGDNGTVRQSGYITAASHERYIQKQISDVTDRYEETREDAYLLGKTVNMPFMVDADDDGGFDLVVEAGGQVGIGTATPGAELEIWGVDPEIRLTDTGDSEYTRITRSDTDGKAIRYNRCREPATGKALDFDAAEYVSIGDVAELNFERTDAFSMAAWVKTTSGGTISIYSKEVNSGDYTGYMLFTAGGVLRVNIIHDVSPSNYIEAYSTGTINDGTWHLVGLTYDGSSSAAGVHLYVNGSEPGTHTATDTLSGSIQNATGAQISGRGGTGIIWDGQTDELGIWKRELVATDMSDLYNGGDGLQIDKDINFPTSGTSMGLNLQGLWHLDEGTGTNAADSSDSGNDGTLTSMEEEDWEDAKVPATGADTEVIVWQSEDGGDVDEEGIQTFGDPDGRTVIDGKTIRFNIDGVEKMQMDNNGNVGIATDSPDATFQVAGDCMFGDDTNDLLISSAGVVTMTGTAKRVLNLRPDLDFTKITAQGKPTAVVYGAFSGYSLPLYAVDEEMFFSMNTPGRWDGESDAIVHILIALSAGEDVNDDFNLQLSWEHADIGEPIENTTHDVEVETNLVAGRVTAYDTYEVSFTLDYDVDTPDILLAHDLIVMRLRRIAVVGTEITGEVIVLDYHMEFIVDKVFGAP